MKKAHTQCFIKSAVPQLKRRGTADFLYGMFTINNTKNTADYEAESLPIISGMLILFSSSFQAFIGLCCKPCADALENLNKRDKQNNRKEHNKILIAVIAVVYRNFSETAAAYDSAHCRIAENCGYCYCGI